MTSRITTQELSFKELKKEDRERIKQLLSVFVKQGEHIRDHDIDRTVNRDEYTLLGAYDEKGRLVGVCDLIEVNLFVGKTGIIDEVVVDPDCRGLGIGTQLLEKAIELAKKKGMRHLKLDTNADNPANGLYEKVGFIRKQDNVYKFYL